MKKKILVIAIAVVLLVVLFVPFKKNYYDDGGSYEYVALTYKVVNCVNIEFIRDENEAVERVEKSYDTRIYWFPNNF